MYNTSVKAILSETSRSSEDVPYERLIQALTDSFVSTLGGFMGYYKQFPVYGTLVYSRLCCNLSNPHCFKISVKIRNSKVAIIGGLLYIMSHFTCPASSPCLYRRILANGVCIYPELKKFSIKRVILFQRSFQSREMLRIKILLILCSTYSKQGRVVGNLESVLGKLGAQAGRHLTNHANPLQGTIL